MLLETISGLVRSYGAGKISYEELWSSIELHLQIHQALQQVRTFQDLIEHQPPLPEPELASARE